MPLVVTDQKPKQSRPVRLIAKDGLDGAGLDAAAVAWAKQNGFSGEAGRTLVLPGADGSVAGALFGLGNGGEGNGALALGALARSLPEGDWHFADAPAKPALAALGLMLGGYVFTRYG